LTLIFFFSAARRLGGEDLLSLSLNQPFEEAMHGVERGGLQENRH
jgi:hypothetical protein